MHIRNQDSAFLWSEQEIVVMTVNYFAAENTSFTKHIHFSNGLGLLWYSAEPIALMMAWLRLGLCKYWLITVQIFQNADQRS